MTRQSLDGRDHSRPLPFDPEKVHPLAVLLSARAVTAVKEMKLPVWEVKRGDWLAVP